MADVAHSTLTGSDLHENKGVAAATDDTVATATSGATVWKKLTAANLAASANPFAAQLLHLREEQASGVAPQALPAATWTTRTLNTVKTNEISGASLASNVITLPAGTYWAEISAPAYQTAQNKLKLLNITAGTNAIYGSSEHCTSGTGVAIRAIMDGRFTLAGTSTLRIEHYSSLGAGQGGIATSSGIAEVYTDVKIWKIA